MVTTSDHLRFAHVTVVLLFADGLFVLEAAYATLALATRCEAPTASASPFHPFASAGLLLAEVLLLARCKALAIFSTDSVSVFHPTRGEASTCSTPAFDPVSALPDAASVLLQTGAATLVIDSFDSVNAL